MVAVRRFFLLVPIILVIVSMSPTAGATPANRKKTDQWVGTWASSPQLATPSDEPPPPAFTDSTLRQIVHVSIGGTKLRVRFSNAFGKTALTITSAHVAKAAGGGTIQAGSDKPLTFDERPSITIPAGALIYSDELSFELAPLSDLAVTIYLRGSPDGTTAHPGSRATSYFTAGDAVSATELPSAHTVDHWYFLNGVDVAGPDSSAAVVVLGDSITDGRGSTTNGNDRWPDVLARRLHANQPTINVGLLNEATGGNRLLHDGLGPNALARLDRDVLAQTRARWLILLEGVNDIGTCKDNCDLDSLANDIIVAYQQIILRAHSQNMRVYGATITPFGGSSYATPETERARQTVNRWIRTSGCFDAVIDFDAVIRDSNSSPNLSRGSDSGDHLHLNATGYKALGDSIDLKLFEQK
jgi:lysophospholipase L1-like esterase